VGKKNTGNINLYVCPWYTNALYLGTPDAGAQSGCSQIYIHGVPMCV
jgi:hypothetical protein